VVLVHFSLKFQEDWAIFYAMVCVISVVHAVQRLE
jgi:hypothetical protein